MVRREGKLLPYRADALGRNGGRGEYERCCEVYGSAVAVLLP